MENGHNRIAFLDNEQVELDKISSKFLEEMDETPIVSSNPADLELWANDSEISVIAVDQVLEAPLNGLDIIVDIINSGHKNQNVKFILYTKGVLSPEEVDLCKSYDIQYIDKKDDISILLHDIKMLLSENNDESSYDFQAEDNLNEGIYKKPQERTHEQLANLVTQNLKESLISKLKIIDDQEAVITSMNEEYTIAQLIREIDSETSLGQEYLLNYINLKDKLNEFKIKI